MHSCFLTCIYNWRMQGVDVNKINLPLKLCKIIQKKKISASFMSLHMLKKKKKEQMK